VFSKNFDRSLILLFFFESTMNLLASLSSSSSSSSSTFNKSLSKERVEFQQNQKQKTKKQQLQSKTAETALEIEKILELNTGVIENKKLDLKNVNPGNYNIEKIINNKNNKLCKQLKNASTSDEYDDINLLMYAEEHLNEKKSTKLKENKSKSKTTLKQTQQDDTQSQDSIWILRDNVKETNQSNVDRCKTSHNDSLQFKEKSKNFLRGFFNYNHHHNNYYYNYKSSDCFSSGSHITDSCMKASQSNKQLSLSLNKKNWNELLASRPTPTGSKIADYGQIAAPSKQGRLYSFIY
jgi:hypothetical protein